MLDALRDDLQRVAFHLDTYTAARRYGLADESSRAFAEATDLVEQLSSVVAAWSQAARRPEHGLSLVPPAAEPEVEVEPPAPAAEPEPPAEPAAVAPPASFACDWPGCTETFDTAGKRGAHRRKHARAQLQAEARDLRIEAEQREAAKKAEPPAPNAEPTGTMVGVYEVKTIGSRRFLRCPETLCGKRVVLTDEETQFDIADTLDAHQRSLDCGARAAAAKRR